MIVKVKKLNPNAHIPTQAHDKDFCYDVYATSCEEIEPRIWRYGLGLAFEIKRDFELLGETCLYNSKAPIPHQDVFMKLNLDNSPVKLSLDFRPRSSIYKTGLILSNCEGTIDELYRGEVSAYFYEVVPNKPKYNIGDRIGQIKLGFTLPISFKEGDIDENTERGSNGFGSTGK